MLLIEAQDVADDRRALDQRDAGIVGHAMGPAGQFRRRIDAALHRLDEVGIAPDAVGDARQPGPVVRPLRKHEAGR